MATVFRDHFSTGFDESLWSTFGSASTAGDKAVFVSGSGATSVPSMPVGAEFHFDIRLKDVPVGDNYFSNVISVNVGDDKVMHFDLYVGNHGGIHYVNLQPVLPLHGGVGGLALVAIPNSLYKVLDEDLDLKDFNFYIEGNTLSMYVGNHLVNEWTDSNIASIEAPFYFLGASLGITAEIRKVTVKTDSSRNI